MGLTMYLKALKARDPSLLDPEAGASLSPPFSDAYTSRTVNNILQLPCQPYIMSYYIIVYYTIRSYPHSCA